MASSLALTLRVPPRVIPTSAVVAKTHITRKVQAKKSTLYKVLPGSRPPSSLLSDATWARLQSMLANAKTLRTITRVVLSFFKDYEVAQSHQKENTLAAYPVAVPISEVYAMFACRKRRVYDVLHVLEGVGILKRVCGVDGNGARFRNGHYVYFGKRGALERLRALQLRSKSIIADGRLKTPCLPRLVVDQRLVQTPPAENGQLHTPDLTSTTASVLSLLLGGVELGHATHLLYDISQRLVESSGILASEARDKEIPVEVNRRIYDVVSVLAILNVVNLSRRVGDAQSTGDVKPRQVHRKEVTFNSRVFSNSNLIRVGDTCSTRLEKVLTRECSKPDTEHDKPSLRTRSALQTTKLPPRSTYSEETSLEDLFPCIDSITEVDERMVEWWNVPLRDLLLQDALEGIDFLDWEIMQAISRTRVLHAERLATAGDSSYHESMAVDLSCHELLEPTHS